VEFVPVQAISRFAEACARWQVHRAVGLLERKRMRSSVQRCRSVQRD
jgi:hypothetical protein